MTIQRRALRVIVGAAMVSVSFGATMIPSPAHGVASDLQTTFATLRANAVWPVQGGVLDAITSTFGPRIKVSTSAYDWHRGIDIDAPEGTPVLSVLGGTFFGIRNYADGGSTVILKHEFPNPVSFQGRTLTSFYTYSMHLSTIESSLVAAAATNQTPVVAKGAQIGTVGHSGTAIDDHLHLEVRVGSPYSLEWQLQNPTSQYGANNFGFDPHVHPLLLVPPATTHGMGLTLRQTPTATRDGRVRFTADDDRPLLNRMTVTIVRKSDGRVMNSHTLDLNLRLGFDATTNAALDTPTTTKPYFSPLPFGTVSPYATELVIPKSWVGTFSGSKFRTTVTATDIWGNSTTLSW